MEEPDILMAIGSVGGAEVAIAGRGGACARITLTVAALVMAAAVALGAFGAHGLRAHVPAELIATWQTAVQYHAWHGLALFATGLLMLRRPPGRALGVAAALFVAGIALFSGSLYALVLTGARALGAVTPLGGIAFIAGWVALAWGAWKNL